jgi:enterochelin esterase-like enzyme
MQMNVVPNILIEKRIIRSLYLERDVEVDFYLPCNIAEPEKLSLLLINDGQNLDEMKFAEMLDELIMNQEISPILCVGIHANEDRKMEYGIAAEADYLGRGAKAKMHQLFILEELLPVIKASYFINSFDEISVAGFSLGGLTALDTVWNHPGLFTKVGVFSGSLWWRSVDQDDPLYDDDKHRIMHQQIRKADYKNGLKFFFQCGNMDETSDRNNNGIIDSIDDTLDLIKELTDKGYDRDCDIHFLEMKHGKHDIPTWALAIPDFLKWGWGR